MPPERHGTEPEKEGSGGVTDAGAMAEAVRSLDVEYVLDCVWHALKLDEKHGVRRALDWDRDRMVMAFLDRIDEALSVALVPSDSQPTERRLRDLLDWIERDRRERDKVLTYVQQARSALDRAALDRVPEGSGQPTGHGETVIDAAQFEEARGDPRVKQTLRDADAVYGEWEASSGQPTEQMIEAGARALFSRYNPRGAVSWRVLDEADHGWYRDTAEAVLRVRCPRRRTGMGGRDHSCEVCGGGGLNDRGDNPCVCGLDWQARVEVAEVEVERLREALGVAADDLDKAANQFEGLGFGLNSEKFAEKERRARGALSRARASSAERHLSEARELAKFAVAVLDGDHTRAGEACGEDACWLCALDTRAKEFLAHGVPDSLTEGG